MKSKLIKVCCGVALSSMLAVSLASCKKTYTITFDTVEGNTVEGIVFEKGGKLDQLPTPTKDGFVFGGWYTDPDLTKEFNLSDPLPESDFTLYADWNVELSFDSKGGNTIESMVGDPLKPASSLPTPVRPGFVFVGWYKDEALTQEQKAVFPAKNTKCYAKWAVAEETTAVTLGSFVVNDKEHYTVEGNKFTVNEAKNEYSFFAANVNFDVQNYGAVKLNVKGSKDAKVLVKVEGSSNGAYEQTYTMTGENQTIIMPVEAKFFQNVGQLKVLLFMAPGVLGTESKGQYIEVQKAQIVKTVAEGTENKESAVFFVTNGADPIAPLFGKINSPLTMPENPTKPYSVFGGWYTDAEFTTKFEGTTFPTTATTLYAKWESSSKELNMLTDTFVENDPNTIQVSKNEKGELVLNKDNNEGWKFVKSTLKGSDIKGLTHLKIEVTGTKGTKALFKVNNQQPAEKWVELTGEKQYVVFDFSKININDNDFALLIFVNPDQNCPCQMTISTLEFTNTFKSFSFLGKDELKAWGPDDYAITSAENTLTIERKLVDGEYPFIASQMKGKDIMGAKKCVITVKGKAGDKVLFKLLDQVEHIETLDGTTQTFVYDLPEINPDKIALLVCLNPAVKAATAPMVFTQIDYLF